MNRLIEDAISSASQHLGEVIRMMYEGVAFHDAHNTRLYNVFSHEGDELGSIEHADVSYAICYMKKLGRPVGKLEHRHWDPVTKKYSSTVEPAFSFAWEGWHPIDQKRLLAA